MRTVMSKRLDTIEAAIPDPMPCGGCKDWPRVLIRHQSPDGAYTTADLGGWPAEPICPVCGRRPRLTVDLVRSDARPLAS